MTVDTWLTLLVNGATLITAVAALLAIREMKRQRESSYRPELILNESYFSISAKGAAPSAIDIRYHSRLGSSPVSAKEYRWSSPVIECVNAGAGPANRIEWTWSFDIESALSQVLSSGPLTFELTKDEYSITFSEPGIISFEEFTPRKRTHVFASSAGGGLFPLHIPNYYLVLFALRAYSMPGTDSIGRDVSAALATFPKLTLHLRYRDLGGNEHSSMHVFQLQLRVQHEPAPTELILEGSIVEQPRQGQRKTSSVDR